MHVCVPWCAYNMRIHVCVCVQTALTVHQLAAQGEVVLLQQELQEGEYISHLPHTTALPQITALPQTTAVP